MSRLTASALITLLIILALAALTGCGGSVSANSPSTPRALVISTTAVAPAVQGANYSVTLQASGGTAPYAWGMSAGQLPTGLNIGTSGTISGVPTQSGSFSFSASAKDANGATASQALTLAVNTPLAITTTALPQATTGIAFTATLQASGGVSPYTWSVSNGQLPAGLTLSGATISGTPTLGGTSNFTLQVRDSGIQTVSTNLQLVVSSALDILTSTVPDGTVGRVYQTQLTAGGGTPPYTWQIVSGAMPAGLTLSSSGLVSGTPSQAVETTVQIQVTDSSAAASAANGSGGGSGGGNGKSKGVKFRVYKPVAITTTSMPPATVGSAYNQTLQVSGGLSPYAWAIASGQLPPGLALNGSTGTISGTPSSSGSFNFTVGVSDSASPSGSASEPLTLATNPTPTQLTVITTALAGATVGVSYSATLQAASGTAPYTWSISSGSLPAGLALNASTGVISGAPTTAGTASFTVAVKDSAATPATDTQALTLAVAPPPLAITTTSLPGATAGASYLATLQASGGVAPYSWSVSSGSLPAGLTLNASTGSISGTPTAYGSFDFIASAKDSATTAASVSKALTLTVAPPPLAITTGSLGNATAGTAYSVTLQAIGGVTPYSWSISSGSLPAGLTLNAGTGLISGTPAASGSFTITASVRDSAATAATASKALTLTVAPAPTLLITTTTLPDGQVGTSYYQSLAATGGVAPYTWSLSSGTLPAGLTLDPNSGALYGTPSGSGTFSIGLRVQDSVGGAATANLSLKVAAVALAILTSALPEGSVGVPYDTTLAANGGTPPYTWSLTSGALPASLALATSGQISGTPGTEGTVNVTFQVKDAAQQTASAALSLSVLTTAFDQYGGRIDVNCAGGVKSSFYLEKIGTQWWFCTPAGHGFFMQGLYMVDYAFMDRTDPQGVNGKTVALAKYNGSGTLWAEGTLQRIRSWGFNTTAIQSSLNLWPMTADSSWPADAWGQHTIPTKQPFVLTTRPGLNAMKNASGYLSKPVKDVFFAMPASYNNATPINYRGHPIADWYDPAVITWAKADLANSSTYSYIKNSHYADYLVGISCDDADNTWGFNAGDAFPTNPTGSENVHLGWAVAVMSPVVSATSPNFTATALTDRTVYVKKQWHDYLVGKYGTIGALNSAWGSNYTTFDSSGTNVAGEGVGSGTGAQTTFTKTLAHTNISPYTIVVKVNGTAVGGDCPKWTYQCGSPAHDASFTGGSPISTLAGDVTYASGAITIVFNSAPASGAAITVDYAYNGWGYGTGLMDEDGRASHTWLGTNDTRLTNANTSFKADADTILGNIADHFFGAVCRDTIKAAGAFPNTLFLGPDSLTTWSIPSRAPVINAASKYLDAFITSDVWAMTQDMMNYIYNNSVKEMPVIAGYYRSANADSPMNQLADGLYRGTGTHEQKGQDFYNYVAAYRAVTYPSGSHPVIGINVWGYFDMWGEQTTWGLVTHRDNAYDGHEAVTGRVACSPPLEALTCGGEDVAAATYPSWQANHSYSWNLYSFNPNNRVVETINGTSYIFEASPQSSSDWARTGTSAGTKCSPTGTATCFPTTYNAKFTDGTVIWTNVGAKTNSSGYGDMITNVKRANALWVK